MTNTLNGMKVYLQSEITSLNEKRAKVLSVLSPNDIDILDGILDSGSEAEL